MKIIAPLLLLLVAVPTVAAKPRDLKPGERVSYTKDPQQPPAGTPVAVAKTGDWLELATPIPCKHGRTFVTLSTADELLSFKQLRIDAHRGRPMIQSMRIMFADGTRQIVKLEKQLDARGQRSAIIDLQTTKPIDSIVIDTDWRAKGTFTVHGAPDRTAVARR